MPDVSTQEIWSWVAPILLHVRQRHVGDGHVQRLMMVASMTGSRRRDACFPDGRLRPGLCLPSLRGFTVYRATDSFP
jgi:hypothetical protein